MSDSTLPLLLYGLPSFFPTPRRIHIYLAEKLIPSSFLITVPHLDESADAEWKKKYPLKPEGFIPVLAIPDVAKLSASSADITDAQNYTWLYQSMAIIEYLEDLCDADPSITSVTSLRGTAGHGLRSEGPEGALKRAQIRGIMHLADEFFVIFGNTVTFGNKHYEALFKRSNVNLTAALNVKKLLDQRVRTKLEQWLPAACDFEALASDEPGTATIADCVLYALLQFTRGLYGVNLAYGFPNLGRFEVAFGKRKSAELPGFPPAEMRPFAETWLEGVWEGEALECEPLKTE